MDETKPGPDEVRMRGILRRRGVGYDAGRPAAPPRQPDGSEPDEEWWAPQPAPFEDEPAARPPVFTPDPGYYPRPHVPAVVDRTRDRASAAVSPGTRRLLYNASAAGAGWALGLYHQFAGALTDCGTDYSIRGALVLGAGGSLLIAHLWDRHTRHWWPGIAWIARIPLATAIVALALYAPAA